MSYDGSSDNDFNALFGSEDEASDIDDGRSQSSSPAPQQQQQQQQHHHHHQQQHEEEEEEEEEEETNNNNRELDNLFGSDEDEESEEEKPRRVLKQRSDSEEEQEEDDDDDQARSPYENEYQSNDKQRVEVSLEMPQLPIPRSSNNKYYLAKLPRFLDVETAPFDPDEFELQIEEGLTAAQEQESIREQVESTIRWRRGADKLESNAHLVEWEDGRVSLMLGSECFDVSIKPMGNHEHAYLLAHQTGSGALESQTEFTDHMTFRPSGLKSDTHRHLTAQIADKQVKKNKTKMYFTEKNPELMKQELENQENERLRAQKKLELQRRKADMRNMGIESSSRRHNYDDYDEPADYAPRQTQDRYDEDFVVDDDDYDEEEDISRDNRLDSVKSSGMDRYKRARYSDEEEEEEEEEDYGQDEDDEEEEELVVRRTNKRHKFSSDEDED